MIMESHDVKDYGIVSNLFTWGFEFGWCKHVQAICFWGRVDLVQVLAHVVRLNNLEIEMIGMRIADFVSTD